MDEVAETLLQVHKFLPVLEKRRKFVNAIQECSTLRTEELCNAPLTEGGRSKCRVEKEDTDNKGLVLCRPTLAYMNEQQETAMDRYAKTQKEIEEIDQRLKDDKFKKFAKGMTTTPANPKDKNDKIEMDNLVRKRKALIHRKALLHNQATARTLDILKEQGAYNIAAANDAICQDPRIPSTPNETSACSTGGGLCMIARHGLGNATTSRPWTRRTTSSSRTTCASPAPGKG